MKEKYEKLLDFNYVAENNILAFMVSCIGSLDFKCKRKIAVEKPFGSKETRENKEKKGKTAKVNIQPEFCLLFNNKAFIGETAGGKDVKPSKREYSESHARIWDLVSDHIVKGNYKISKKNRYVSIILCTKNYVPIIPCIL